MVELYFKDGGPLRLHKEILSKSSALLALLKGSHRIPDASIYIDDMSYNAGHIMIHYLLTSTYNTPDNKDTSPDSKKKEELTTALQVYFSAKKYEIIGLADLASQQIKRISMELNLIALLKVLQCEFPGICFIENWIATYLANRIRSEFEALTHESATLLLDDIGGIESINDIVLKCMLQLCRERLSLNDNGNPMECSVSTTGSKPPSSNVGGRSGRL